MLHRPTVRSTVIPVLAALAALVLLNVGLYTRLAPQEPPTRAAIPYKADFSGADNAAYVTWGGDWELREQTLVQLSTTGDDLGTVIPLKIPADQPYQFSTRMRFLGGAMGGGLTFNIQQDITRQHSHMARFNVDQGALYIIYGYYGDNSDFVGQGSVRFGLDPANTDWHTFGAQVGSDTYNLLLDGRVVAAKMPLMYHGGAVGLLTSNAQVAYDDVDVEPLDAQAVAATTAEPDTTQPAVAVTASATAAAASTGPLFRDSFDGPAGESAWVPFSGQWAFESGAYVQKDASGFDFGTGSVATYDTYRLKVTFEHRQGSGGGVYFNMPQANTKAGAQMVRYTAPDRLAWGYFDDQGVFVGQGDKQVDAVGTGAHTLEIETSAAAYDIVLDGQTIAGAVPLHSVGGHVGLTSSQSVVAFTDVEISGPQTAPAGGVQISAVTGDWQHDGQTITQVTDAPIDAIAGVGLSAEKFGVSVDIALPSDIDDAGGGLVFHMNGRDDPSGGMMVRLGSGGKEVFWGSYDAQKTFHGMGSAPLELKAGGTHTLALVVRASDFDILVDDQLVIGSVPHQTTQGWIGLVGFRGPITFSNFGLTLGEG